MQSSKTTKTTIPVKRPPSNFKQQIRIAYDKDAQRREDSKTTRDTWKLKCREKFAHILKFENKQTVLEIGAGVGLDSLYLQQQGFDVLCTDLSPKMVEKATEKGLSAEVLDLYDITKLERKFDGVYSMNVLLHVPRQDLNHILDQIYQSLNTSGIFFYGVYGGADEEKVITDNSKMGLPRFFNFLSDKSLLDFVKMKFSVLSFDRVELGKGKDFYFQSLFLRKL